MTKIERLVEYNVQILVDILEDVVAARSVKQSSHSSVSPESLRAIELGYGQSQTVLEEFKEIICLPKTPLNEIRSRRVISEAALPKQVSEQLRAFLMEVAGLYQNNAFHNYEHAGKKKRHFDQIL